MPIAFLKAPTLHKRIEAANNLVEYCVTFLNTVFETNHDSWTRVFPPILSRVGATL